MRGGDGIGVSKLLVDTIGIGAKTGCCVGASGNKGIGGIGDNFIACIK